MQSKTSFFNKSVFRKSVSRFWPVWGAYLAVWIFLLPIVILANRYDYSRFPNAARTYIVGVSLYGGLAMTAVFGVFSAMAVWGYQFSARSAHGMACLPVRREGMFVSSALAGLLPMLAANAIVFLLGYLAAVGVGCADFGVIAQGFATVSLLLIFFFGFASFCAQLTGNILVLPAVYAVLNFVFVAMELMVRSLLRVFVFGMDYDGSLALKLFSPVVGICQVCRIVNNGSAECTIEYGWLIAVYAAVGVLFLAAALLLYRRRRMETAGDVVAINLLKPVFRWCMAIGCAVCLASLINLIFDPDSRFPGGGQMPELLCLTGTMLLGALIGWFAAEMMIRKSFRVFRRTWPGFGVCCLIIAALMFACEFDLFGYERFVPDPARTQNAVVYCDGETIVLTEPENIAALCGVHRGIVDNKAVNERESTEYGVSGRDAFAEISYQMTNGRGIWRRYRLPFDPNDPVTCGDVLALEKILNCPEAIRSRKELSLPVTPETIEYAGIGWTMSAVEWAEETGCETPEEFVLCRICGFTSGEVSAMNADERNRLLCDAINYNAVYPEGDDLYYYTYDDVVSSFPNRYNEYAGYPAAVREMEGVTPEELADIDWSRIKFNYEKMGIPDAEINELYHECILPDLSDGTLGRIWIITGSEYRNSVYDARISISLGVPEEATDSGWMPNDYFYTVPTVDSVRTNAWLEAHGVTLYTIAER